ncbi:L-threonine 3-dehydrogenase [Streptomyces alboniger]
MLIVVSTVSTRSMTPRPWTIGCKLSASGILVVQPGHPNVKIMQSYRLNADRVLELVEGPTPTPGRGQVLIRVKATSLNGRDMLIASGLYPFPPLPNLIQLSDAAGVIEAVGPDTTRFRVGDRVVNSFNPTWYGGPMRKLGRMYGTDIDGWLTDYAVVDENVLVSMPEHLSFEEAATLPCAALTGWSAVAGVGPGDTVLVQGSGGVSLFALQFARTAGARVIATTSSEAKAERLRELGASDVVNYAETPTGAPSSASSPTTVASTSSSKSAVPPPSRSPCRPSPCTAPSPWSATSAAPGRAWT